MNTLNSEVEVPVFASGLLTRLGRTNCIDAATHLLHSREGKIRLAAGNEHVASVFQKLEGTRMPVRVAGYRKQSIGAQCVYLSVYDAQPALSDTAESFKLDSNGHSDAATCHLANITSAVAFYSAGRILICAEVEGSYEGLELRVEQAPIKIYPPHYQVTFCQPNEVHTGPVVKREVYNVFIASRQKQVTVWGSNGPMKVDVQEPYERPAIGDIDIQGGDIPFPFAGGEIPVPFVLDELRKHQGGSTALKLPKVEPREAVGYSEVFSFDEAFQQAMAALPPDPNPYPDKMTSIRVAEVGARVGGIAGIRQLYVKVVAYY